VVAVQKDLENSFYKNGCFHQVEEKVFINFIVCLTII